MQLTEEYFGKHYVTKEEWESDPSKAAEYMEKDAELFIRTADYFDYCIIFYCQMYRPSHEEFIEGLRILREMDGGRRLIMMHGDSTMAIPDGDNMNQIVIDLFENAGKIKDEQERGVDGFLERGEKLLAAGADGFALCSDYCLNTGPFLSPEQFSEFVAPYLKRLVQGYRDMGAYTIKHTDGNIMPVIDDLINAEPHALHSLDPMAGVDIREIKEKYGNKLCLIGNVNCALMQTGTEEEILESCRYAMESGRSGGGYIFSTSNTIFKGMPRRSYDLMIDFYKKNRRY
jgi:uroporphyrinogen decarboxylase